jgi:hypothetical protein
MSFGNRKTRIAEMAGSVAQREVDAELPYKALVILRSIPALRFVL